MTVELIEHEMVGQEVAYESNRPPYSAKGTITGASRGYGCLINDNGTWGIIKFRINPELGGRAFWTTGFADSKRPLDDAARTFTEQGTATP